MKIEDNCVNGCHNKQQLLSAQGGDEWERNTDSSEGGGKEWMGKN